MHSSPAPPMVVQRRRTAGYIIPVIPLIFLLLLTTFRTSEELSSAFSEDQDREAHRVKRLASSAPNKSLLGSYEVCFAW